MPNHLDILMERLRKFDEVTLLELLNLTSEDILERFKDVVYERRNMLFGEVEFLPTGNDDEDEEELEWDGFQIIEIGEEDNE